MKILEENGFKSPAERAFGFFIVVFIFLMFLIGIAAFIALLTQPLVWVILSLFLIPTGIIYLLSGSKDSDCVMCGKTLKSEHESKYWKGSHEWCDDCY